jgi:hypothetical protein
MKVVGLAEAKDDDLLGSNARDGGPGDYVDEPQVTIGRVCGLRGLKVKPKACQRVEGLERCFCMDHPICQLVFIDIAIFDKTGSRPRLIEYWNEPVTGAVENNGDQASVLTRRSWIISSRCLMRSS